MSNFDFKQPKVVDVQNIFHKMEKRTLAAAYKFYCDKELTAAHSAEVDTLATFEVLKSQLARYDTIKNNVSFRSEFSSVRRFADLAGFIVYKNNQAVFTFGKFKNVSVEKLVKENPGYIDWIMKSHFPLYTKRVIQKIKSELEG